MKMDIFGKKRMEVIRREGEWLAFYFGNDGKKRRAYDIVIPSSLSEREVVGYIADLFHEWATPSNSVIKVIGRTQCDI